MPADGTPLLWRMRHKIGRVWFFIALGMMALGLLVAVYSIRAGDWASVGAGITLVVGGALLAVGFRRKRA